MFNIHLSSLQRDLNVMEIGRTTEFFLQKFESHFDYFSSFNKQLLLFNI
jgi:hypothetical protein